jgi:hypothetical protein
MKKQNGGEYENNQYKGIFSWREINMQSENKKENK